MAVVRWRLWLGVSNVLELSERVNGEHADPIDGGTVRCWDRVRPRNPAIPKHWMNKYPVPNVPTNPHPPFPTCLASLVSWDAPLPPAVPFLPLPSLAWCRSQGAGHCACGISFCFLCAGDVTVFPPIGPVPTNPQLAEREHEPGPQAVHLIHPLQ